MKRGATAAVVTILFAAAAAAGVFLFMKNVRQDATKPQATVDVLVSSQDIPAGTQLDPLIEALVDLSLPVDVAARRARVSPKIAREIARRVDASEYKRRQMPPGPKVTAKAFGEGRRYPIAHRFRV